MVVRSIIRVHKQNKQMKKLRMIMLLVLTTVVSAGFAQNRVISGAVTDIDTGSPLQGVKVTIKESQIVSLTDADGNYTIQASTGETIVFTAIGFEVLEVKIGRTSVINIKLVAQVIPVLVEDHEEVDFAFTRGYPALEKKIMGASVHSRQLGSFYQPAFSPEPQNWNTEEYATINDNIFHNPTRVPLSTFSIDVDAASYSNIRRFLNNGQEPPKDAVRIEEMVNYFNYDYLAPMADKPFSVNTEVSVAPWNNDHKLVHIGIQGKKIATENLPASNLVFLLDVSGSMNAGNKLPLLKSAFSLLVDQLREQDKVSIVVYAGAAGVVLQPTAGNNKEQILSALNKLEAGGSTAGGEGIQLAYKLARENFVAGGNNRIVLATDGDFNIGVSSNAAMERLVEKERESGVFLTVLGFGMGNYKDSKMEILADKGNGNYAYIDNILEAKKVLVSEFGGTMFTIAKDVKIQVEFNPALVQAYRLIGYENRKLNDEDFNDDKKDAGELGSGHNVTALYEIIPVGVEAAGSIDPLKYQQNKKTTKASHGTELMTVKLRYKKPAGSKSMLISATIKDSNTMLEQASENFRWAAAVAEFGMLLRDSEFKSQSSYLQVVSLAQGAKGKDVNGYRSEFLRLVQSGGLLAKN
jgi:Ca-activated chloride channel homolog